MSKARLSSVAPILVTAVILGAVSCSSPRQPVSPGVVDSPRGPVVIDSKMADWVAVPNAHQNYDWTSDGLLKYTFQLQNMTEHSFSFRYKTTFFDASGVTPVDEQGVRRQHLAPAETATVSVVAGNPSAKKVMIQILKDG